MSNSLVNAVRLPGFGLAGALLLSLIPVSKALSAEPETLLTEGLAIRLGGRPARSALHTDAIEALLVQGRWTAPSAGDTVTLADGAARAWEPAVAKADGSFTNAALRGGYVYLPFVSDSPRVMLLQATGHTLVYVNGEPRAGDPYQNGSVSLPVLLRPGTNEFLFNVSRGALRVRLVPPARPLALDLRDTTWPDLIAQRKNVSPGALLVVNSTTNRVSGLVLTATSRGGRRTVTSLPPLLPLSTRKVGFPIEHSGRSATNQVAVTLQLTQPRGRRSEACDEALINLSLRSPDQSRRETFVSAIDGSVQYFARHKIPDRESLRAVHFTTANPGLSASSHWVAIEAQQRDLAPSTVDAGWDPHGRHFTAATENVARLAFDLAHVKPGLPLTATLDGQKLTNLTVTAGQPKLWFTRAEGIWAPGPRPDPAWKGPHRYGPFKEAFQHRMLFVYGTRGTPEENAWALAKARFDAEMFWYRGNGSIDVVPDAAFDPSQERNRGVILYGHADSHASWKSLLGESPVQVGRGWLRIGARELRADDLACLFLRPRPGSDVASVGVVSGTGAVGLRLTDRVPYFTSGVALPDCTVMGPEALAAGAEGARAAGFFGPDWSVDRGEFHWRDSP